VQGGAVVLLSALMLCSGLSVRSLWGPEGRWAEVVREMLLSGNYFLPTINGTVYFDKPLLSYWAIIVFAWKWGVTEAILRLPAALAGMGTVFLTYLMGRRLFGSRTGLISALLLLTTTMFIFWSKTASAELLNVLAIWLALWVFVSGGPRGRLVHYILLYGIAAVASFVKGPVAMGIILFSLTVFSGTEVLVQIREKGWPRTKIGPVLKKEFHWIASGVGLFGLFTGIAIFFMFLLLPVLQTGSWQSASLMWKENVLRFILPFDHIEPIYAYVKYVPLFFVPWTFFLAASLWQNRYSERDRSRRWLLVTTLSIFVFFTLSGSRRSYYILPILPALALITGKALSDWIHPGGNVRERPMLVAALLTALLSSLAGVAILYVHFVERSFADFTQLPVGVITILAGGGAALLFLRRRVRQALFLLLALCFLFQLWGFTFGASAVEKGRTLRPFCQEVSERLKNVGNDKVALYRSGTSSLVFYLNRHHLTTVNSTEEIEKFLHDNPDGFLLIDVRSFKELGGEEPLRRLVPVLAQKPEKGKSSHLFVLLKIGR
jgi:4-amino-4-deoxy-L-arabinose transferase-like glycosyltransferase